MYPLDYAFFIVVWETCVAIYKFKHFLLFQKMKISYVFNYLTVIIVSTFKLNDTKNTELCNFIKLPSLYI